MPFKINNYFIKILFILLKALLILVCVGSITVIGAEGEIG